MDDDSNLVPLLLLFVGGITAFGLAVAIAAAFFAAGPSPDQFLWFAIVSVVAVIGWRELRAGGPFGEQRSERFNRE